MSSRSNDTQWLAAYLVVGEDELKREAVLKRLNDRFDAMGDRAFNSDVIDGSGAEEGTIVAACQTAPFLSPMRLVVVKNADKLRKPQVQNLVAYLKSPADTTVLVLIADKLAKNSALYKAVARVGAKAIIACDPPKARDLPRLVQNMAAQQGTAFSPAAVSRLIELVGEDTVHLNAEVEKIALAHRGSEEVTEGEVLTLVAPVAEVKPWEFLDAFSARDLKRTLAYWRRMPSVSAIGMVAMVATRLRELICAQTLDKRGEGGRLAEVLGKQSWQVKNHLRWARGFGEGALARALSGLMEAEWAMKSGGDADAVFVDWLLATLA